MHRPTITTTRPTSNRFSRARVRPGHGDSVLREVGVARRLVISIRYSGKSRPASRLSCASSAAGSMVEMCFGPTLNQ
jgi:hypothetical protein